MPKVVGKQSPVKQNEETINKKKKNDLEEDQVLKSILRKPTDNAAARKKVTYADVVKNKHVQLVK